MKNTAKLVMVGLFMSVVLFSPSVSNAATVEELNTQRIALIEQLISVLQQKVAALIAQLEAQQKQITTIQEPVFGSTKPMPAPFTISVATEFGKGSWANQRGDETGEERFLDGMVRFVITGTYKKATIEYHEKGKAKDGLMDLSFDGIHGYFQPNTEYVYTIEATNDAGQIAHVEGSFKTGKY